ncbi:MAG: S-methyl-5-thioribose-1-phosphate isomerase [Thermoplasmata archaeon]|nr:S-methyl-5-thioribose-1-phosphate isomerase [Thermoplasmata archaeon]
MAVRALWYSRGVLSVLDQRALPGRARVVRLRTLAATAEAIRTLTVRGAPSIGVAAAYGMVLGKKEGGYSPARAARQLGATRPTAYDLFVGIETVRAAWVAGKDVEAAANAYRLRIVEECHRIGMVGAPLFAKTRRVLTHCNAGALATVEWGTALAPLRVAHDRGARLFVWVDETRPLLQGARLTAWELAREHIPHAVIADNAAGHFFSTGQVDAVIVGADRIARNGDFANKIGTYEKAVLAREHQIPFYVAAPWSTFDARRATGASIPVEERDPEEVATLAGRRITPRSSPARNPAFDVTPARYVTAFITPDGIVRPRDLARVLTRRATPPTEEARPTLLRPGGSAHVRRRVRLTRGHPAR